MDLRLYVQQNAQQTVPYNAEIPIQFGTITDAHFAVPMTRHWHNDFELVAVEEGQICYTVNGVPHLLSAGEGICIAPSQLHGVEPVGKCRYAALVIPPETWCSDEELRKKYLDHLVNDVILLRSGDGAQGRVLETIRAVVEACSTRRYGYELRVKSLLLTALDGLKQPGQSRERADPDLNTLKAMVRAIENALPEQPALARIAAAGAVSEATCCRLFKRYLGTSPGQYALQLRLQGSLNRLQDPTLTIAQVAMAGGFSSPSYYTEQFRRFYGMTPREFRAAL